MRVENALRRMIQGRPRDGAVILTVGEIEDMLGNSEPSFDLDLTVEEAAEIFDRSPVTVRAWIRAGDLRAYKFNNREYRIPQSAVMEYQSKQRGF